MQSFDIVNPYETVSQIMENRPFFFFQLFWRAKYVAIALKIPKLAQGLRFIYIMGFQGINENIT